MRTRSPDIDQTSPAHKVMARFGGLTAFANAIGCPITTAHRWLKNGLIPASRQAEVLTAAQGLGMDLDPAEFVPLPMDSAA